MFLDSLGFLARAVVSPCLSVYSDRGRVLAARVESALCIVVGVEKATILV